MAPTRAEIRPQDQVVKLLGGRIGKEPVVQLGFAEFTFERKFETVLRVFARLAAGIAVDAQSAVYRESGRPVR